MLNIRSFTALAHDRLGQIKRDQRGVSAVEFAMLAPLMISLYFGVIEISQGVAVDRKVMLSARSVADLVAQSTSVTATDLKNITDAAISITEPFPTADLKAIVSQVSIDSTGVAKIVWSYASANATKRPDNQVVTTEIPPDLIKPANTPGAVFPYYLIWGEVEYPYKPVYGRTIVGTLTFKEKMFMSPRQSAKVDKL